MCGIIGYIGNRKTLPILMDGLKRLEYRGYDSAGIALIDHDEIISVKQKGKVSSLQETLNKHNQPLYNTNHVGIAHTRWATHGSPNQLNAHPHLSSDKKFAIAHNGIIENYQEIKEKLFSHGIEPVSETDSEVIALLVSHYYDGNLLEAVAKTLKQLRGTYGLVIISVNQPDTLIAARQGSPIVIGLGNTESVVASDVSAILTHTNQVIYLNDGDIALIKPDDIDIRNLDNVPVTRTVAEIDWEPEAIKKNGYEHFMLKEIHEQPAAINDAIRGRIDWAKATAILSGMNLSPQDIRRINRIVIAACGTSYHAGMIGKYYFEDLADIPTNIEQAAEFRYRNPIVESGTLVIANSQSGETADTLAAVREAKNKGAEVAGICNVIGSTIARETGRGVYLHAGPEISVASTKAFTCQVAVFLLLAVKFGRSRRLSYQEGEDLLQELQNLPNLITAVLQKKERIKDVAKHYAEIEDIFFIGRGYLYPAALEGALKLKEISYIHAEGYHAAELKHGPIALLEEKVPVVALANNIAGKDKIISNIQECKARKSPVIAVCTEGDSEIKQYADHTIEVPHSSCFLTPIITVTALQLLAYYIALHKGCSIDQPRNLAKSVTVE